MPSWEFSKRRRYVPLDDVIRRTVWLMLKMRRSDSMTGTDAPARHSAPDMKSLIDRDGERLSWRHTIRRGSGVLRIWA